MGCIAKVLRDMDRYLQLMGFVVLQAPVETDDLKGNIDSRGNKANDGCCDFECN